jgi:hypothetical protein
MAGRGLGARARKLAALVSAAAVVFAFGYAAHGSRSAGQVASSRSGVALHASSALKSKQAEKALAALLKNSKPTIDLIGKRGSGPTQARIPAAPLKGTSVKNQLASPNWSGYVSSSSTKQEYTKVYGSWKIPKAYCTTEQRLASVWVGLDGFNSNSNTVEQDGTTSFCFEGTAYYYTWYELYPNATFEEGSAAAAGDSITASVTRTGTTYTFKLTDSTNTANSFSVTGTCGLGTCLDNSAEWIIERPAYSIGVTPLTDIAPVSFVGGGTIAGGKTDTIAASPGETDVDMVDATDTYPLDTIGTVSGGTFLAKWVNSY